MPSQPPSLVIHVPHAATAIPADVRPTLLLADLDLERELLAMTDHYTDELFSLPANLACTVRFPVSRLVVDPERFESDEQEAMAARGMGAVYTRTSDGRPLRAQISPSHREQLLARYYRPHHSALSESVGAALATHGSCLLVDAHSFPSRPLPYEEDRDPDRPDVCIGTDPFHTQSSLRDAACEAFRTAGLGTAVNRPFSGALVPARFYARDQRVASIMIEVNRRLYMDEATGIRLGRFGTVKALVSRVVQDLHERLIP